MLELNQCGFTLSHLLNISQYNRYISYVVSQLLITELQLDIVGSAKSMTEDFHSVAILQKQKLNLTSFFHFLVVFFLLIFHIMEINSELQ